MASFSFFQSSLFSRFSTQQEMRRIINPWKEVKEFKCFGCCAENDGGLRMQFLESSNGELMCRWTPQHRFDGWPGIVHGGIQCTLMDEMAAWVVLHDLKVSGVTARLDTKFLKPLSSRTLSIVIKGKLEKNNHRLAWVDVWIENAEGERCAEAKALYYTFSREDSIKNYYYSDMQTEEITEETNGETNGKD